MMENKKYLTEENYKKGQKKLRTIILIILSVGFLIGGGLILTGIIKTNTVRSEIAKEESSRTENDVQSEITDVESQIETIETEITTLETEISKLRNEQNKIFQEDRNFSERYYAKGDEITKKRNELSSKGNEKRKLEMSKNSLKTELWKIQSGFNTTSNSISTPKYTAFYMIGGFIIVTSCMFSVVLYIFLKRREIAAFSAQQIIPVAKEGIDEMAPTIGNAVGEIAKGIKNGIKDDKE